MPLGPRAAAMCAAGRATSIRATPGAGPAMYTVARKGSVGPSIRAASSGRVEEDGGALVSALAVVVLREDARLFSRRDAVRGPEMRALFPLKRDDAPARQACAVVRRALPSPGATPTAARGARGQNAVGRQIKGRIRISRPHVQARSTSTGAPHGAGRSPRRAPPRRRALQVGSILGRTSAMSSERTLSMIASSSSGGSMPTCENTGMRSRRITTEGTE